MIPAPRGQGLLQQRLPADFKGPLLVHVQALDDGVGESRHCMVRVHPAGIAGHFREGGSPVVPGLLRHPDEGGEDVLLQGRGHHHAQRVRGAVGVPDPVVRVERRAAVLMDLVVEGAPVAAVLAQAHRALEGTVVGGVEHGLFRLVPAADFQAAEGLVPGLAAFGGHFLHVERVDFPTQVRRRLLLADEGDAVADMDLRHVENLRHAGVPAAVGLAVQQLAMAEISLLHGFPRGR